MPAYIRRLPECRKTSLQRSCRLPLIYLKSYCVNRVPNRTIVLAYSNHVGFNYTHRRPGSVSIENNLYRRADCCCEAPQVPHGFNSFLDHLPRACICRKDQSCFGAFQLIEDPDTLQARSPVPICRICHALQMKVLQLPLVRAVVQLEGLHYAFLCELQEWEVMKRVIRRLGLSGGHQDHRGQCIQPAGHSITFEVSNAK